jgi:putative oxidoreductase
MSDLTFGTDTPPHRLDKFIERVPRMGLALAFLGIGYSKFDAHGSWVRTFDAIGLGQWLRDVTGVMQALGGVLLLYRRTAPAGAVSAGCTMLGAIAAQLFVLHGGPLAIVPAILLAALVAVGWRAAQT